MTLEELILSEAFEGKEIRKQCLSKLKAAIARYENIYDIWEKLNYKNIQLEVPDLYVDIMLNGKLDSTKRIAFQRIGHYYQNKQSKNVTEFLVNSTTNVNNGKKNNDVIIIIIDSSIVVSYPYEAEPEKIEDAIKELKAAGSLTYLLSNASSVTLPTSAADIRKTIINLFNNPTTSITSFIGNAPCTETALKSCADYLGAKFTVNLTPENNWKLGTIDCVLEGLIRRVALVKVAVNSYNGFVENIDAFVSSLNTDPVYNVLDAGRNVFAKRNYNRYSLPKDISRELVYTNVVKTQYSLPIGELKALLQREFSSKEPGTVVTEADISNIVLLDTRSKKATKVKEEKLNKALETIKFNLRKIDSGPKDDFTTINDMKVYRDRVEYDGEIFKAETIKPTEPFLAYMTATRSINDFNFNMYLNQFIKRIIRGTCKATIGTIDVNFEIRNNGKAVLFYINGYKIVKSEVEQVLRQALCFEKTEEYDKFLKKVSQCSLKITNLLNNGLQFAIASSRYASTSTIINLKIERDKNKNFLVLDDKTKFQISNINALIRSMSISVVDLINVLTDPKVTTLTDRDTAMKLMIKGKTRQEDAIKKSEELLRNTEKVLKLEESQEVINGTTINGYLVVGASGNKYFVDSSDKSIGSHGGHYPVYSLPSGQALCIVDKASHLSQIGKDALVNRLFALKNDKLVAKHISTLGL